MSPTDGAPLARMARQAVLSGRMDEARDLLAALVEDVTARTVGAVHINTDQYSLNSLNGVVTFEGGVQQFFKFHQEEGEESTLQEYYNAELLHRAGFDVDLPTFACGEPGRQILLYHLHAEPRLADVCRSLDDAVPGDPALEEVLTTQRLADRAHAQSLLATLHPASEVSRSHLLAQPIHQLFHHRLVSGPHRDGFGGRVAEYYVGASLRLGTHTLGWSDLADRSWVVNGVPLGMSLREAFTRAMTRLTPTHEGGVVTAHGDDHNANIWYARSEQDHGHEQDHHLVLFDPAFAGDAVPALLAPVKATFHNVFAHPLWLYEPTLADTRYHVDVRLSPGTIEVTHDFALTPLRTGILESKLSHMWEPLLRELHARTLLAEDWRQVMDLALFTCPTLVFDLAGPAHTPTTTALGLAVAMSLAAGASVPGSTDALRDWQERMGAELTP